MKKIEMIKKVILDEGYDEFIFNCRLRNLREYIIKFYDNNMLNVYKFIEFKIFIYLIIKDIVDNFILFCKNKLNIKSVI